jgi:hypothetical protein
MVHVRDEGSYFEGSIQTVWRFLNSDEPHSAAHRSIRHREVKPAGENMVTVSMERNWRGNWVRVVNHLTVLPPLGTITEAVEGPFAGSKQFTIYTPEWGRTRVDVYGEYVSPTLPPAEVKDAALAWLEESYNEDAPAVKALQQTI